MLKYSYIFNYFIYLKVILHFLKDTDIKYTNNFQKIWKSTNTSLHAPTVLIIYITYNRY